MSNPGMVDMFGKELSVGDTIVVAFPVGSSAMQRVGKILEFSEKRNRDRMKLDGTVHAVAPSPVIVVEWDAAYSKNLPHKPSKLEKFHQRIVKIG